MVNEVFDVSAQFDTCRQVFVESGVNRPFLDLILGRSVPNPHTPIFGDPKYAWLTPLSTYGSCFGQCLSAGCKDVAVDRDMPWALVVAPSLWLFPTKKELHPKLYVSWHWFGMLMVPWRAGVRIVQ